MVQSATISGFQLLVRQGQQCQTLSQVDEAPRTSTAVPDFQWLQDRWVDDECEDPLHRKSVAQGVRVVASELHVVSWSLRLHMKTEGFDHVNPWTDAQVQKRIVAAKKCHDSRL